ncbi:MAG: glycosyltransferase [Acidimicrobiales bacterium]|jgi:D-inositol-3-phosphate glycosyltransferase
MRAVAVLSMHTSPLAQPGSADAGGMNVYVRELATALARSGARCEVYTRRDDPAQPASLPVEPGLRVHHVPAGPAAPVAKELLAPLVGEWAAGVGESLAALSAKGEPVDLLHANYWLSATAGHTLKHVLSLPLATTFHTLGRVKARSAEETPEPGREEGEQQSADCSDLLVACSRSEADDLVRLYGAGPERVATVLPGVHRAFFAPGDQAQARRAVGLPEGAPVVLFVGRIQALKGLAVATKAIALLSGATRSGQALFVVVGGPSGPRGEEELANAKAIAERSGLGGRVRWVPAIPHELLSSYYRAADVCVVPSWSESFGLVALEASACAVPVVASAVGGLADLVDHGRTGYLVAPGDVEGFAHYLKELLEDMALARLMGAAALEASSPYTWPAAATRFSELIASLAGRDLVNCG